jgi:NAD(P)-dependent dehydrogenase (short-subunit alcohol dehydrogenase family)
LGQALAESFAVAGARLVLTYNNTPPPAELKKRCVQFGAAGVEFVKCNVAELEGCEGLVRKVSLLFGIGRE